MTQLANNKTKPRRNRPGWKGGQVTEICGLLLNTEEQSLRCLLPPKHYPEHIHATIAQDLENPNGTVVIVIQDNEKEKILWQDVQPP